MTQKKTTTEKNIELLLSKYTIKNIAKSKLKNKRVLVRIDANVPIRNGEIADDARLRKSLATIRFLLRNGAKQVVLCSHLGRPKGVDPQYSLEIVAKRLSQLLKRKVGFIEDITNVGMAGEAEDIQKAKVVLLENVRFNNGEKKNSSAFAKKLASYAQIYVNDAFGTAHRKHASNNAITRELPSYIGCLMENEVKQLSKVVFNAKKPFVVLVGFAKITDKIKILTKLLTVADTVLIGGAVSQTFFLAQNKEVGKSLIEKEQVELAKKILQKYEEKIVLPKDVVVAKTLASKQPEVVDVDSIPKEKAVFDIGPKTITLFSKYIKGSKTLFWNGPVGVFEFPLFAKATNILAKKVAQSPTFSIIGGGDTANAIQKSGESQNMKFISTGGGASLSFIEKPLLPAFVVMLKKRK